MNQLHSFKPSAWLAAGLAIGFLLRGGSGLLLGPVALPAHAEQKPAAHLGEADDGHRLLQPLSDHLPDQSHVMADIGYHFANLWFAGDNQNWPLANYYLGETRSHLRWAVRLHPVRKTTAGTEVDLKGILDAVDNSFLTKIGEAITNKDLSVFKTAYRETLQGCYACHEACEKPFLRPQIPTAPGVSIINFDPAGASPE